MRKLLNNRWFVAALTLAAIALVWSSLQPSATSSPSTFGSDAIADLGGGGEPLPSPTSAPAVLEALKQVPLPASPRDPFAARVVVETTSTTEQPVRPESVETVHLSGIWTQNGATLVLINERIWNVGEAIGRLTIESAESHGVWLSHWRGRTFLALGKSFVLKTPANLPGSVTNP